MGKRHNINGHSATVPTGTNPNTIVVQAKSSSFSGPLPPPSILAQYNDVIPNGAERIMAMAERQSAHREYLESRVINGNVENQTRGSYFAFIICMTAIIFGFILIEQGRNTVGLSSILVSVSGITATFIYSKRQQKRERIEKAKTLQERKEDGPRK